MDFDIEIVHSVQKVGQTAWDCLGKGQPFTSYRWYCFGEAVLVNNIPIYIILSQKGKAMARATFWLTRQEPLPIESKVVRGLVQTMIRHWPLLVCRSPLASTSGLILPDPPLRETALRTILQVAQNQAQQYGASFLVFDYLASYETGWQGWLDNFISTEVPDPGTRLVINWSNFESYVRGLTKRMRKSYRRHCRLANELDITTTSHSKVITPLDKAMVLIRNVEKRHNSSPNPWVRGMLEHASMVDSTWLTAHINGKLVGCELMLGDKGTRFLTALGLDYSVQYVYFKLGYEDINCAIKDEVQILRGGSGAYDVKRRLGFELEDNNYVVFTPSKPVLRWVRP